MDGIAATFRFPRPTRENLPRLADFAFSTAMRCCGACRNYHATWTYLRSLGLNGGGPEFNHPAQVALLSGLLAGRSEVRWLLAGSADAGVVAVVHDVADTMAGSRHDITVVDRCPTPLAVCRRHADDRGLAVRTVQSDLLAFDEPGMFDIVVGHQLVPFFAGAARAAFFRKAASWLTTGGLLVLTIHDEVPGNPSARIRRQWRMDRIRAGVATGSIELPEDLDTFLSRLERPEIYGERDRNVGVEDHTALLRDIGFTVREPVPLEEIAPAQLETRTRYAIIAKR